MFAIAIEEEVLLLWLYIYYCIEEEEEEGVYFKTRKVYRRTLLYGNSVATKRL